MRVNLFEEIYLRRSIAGEIDEALPKMAVEPDP